MNLIINNLILALLVSMGEFVPRQEEWVGNSTLSDPSNFQERQVEWQRVNPSGEEISILTPVAPTLIRLGGDYYFGASGERVLEHRSYGGYAEGFNFFIDSYKAERPQKLLKALDGQEYPRKIFESDVQISGVKAKQYRLDSPNFYGKRYSLVTKKHVYLITVASRGENDASIERFINSMVVGDKIAEAATGQVVDVRDTPEYKSSITIESHPSQPQGQTFNPKDVRKAIIVARPEPAYTDQARQNQTSGTVILRGVLGADGQVRSLRVRQGLDDGLTGKAIEAALCIRFFPAEKDGKLVSQYIQIEYNFNLY